MTTILKHVLYNPSTKTHILYDSETKVFERWVANKDHAGYRHNYKNTHLEFCSSYSEAETRGILRYMRKVQNFGEQHTEFHSTLMNVYRKYIA